MPDDCTTTTNIQRPLGVVPSAQQTRTINRSAAGRRIGSPLAFVASFLLMGAGASLHAQNFNPNGFDAVLTMSQIEHPSSDLVLLSSHRGLHALVNGTNPGIPENALDAIGLAAQAGLEEIEIDIKLTSDGVPVLSHDLTIGRETCPLSNPNLAFNPFLAQGSNPNNDAEDYAVSSMTASDLSNFHFVRDTISLIQKQNQNGNPALSCFFPNPTYIPTLKQVLDYMTQNKIAMVLALDLRDGPTAAAAWSVIQPNTDYLGRSYASSTLFKIPGKSMGSPANFKAQFGQNWQFVNFQPVYNTGDIAPSVYGSETGIIQSLQAFENDFTINVAAVEIQIKELNGILSSVLSAAKTNSRTGQPESVTVFSPYADYYDPSDVSQSTPEFFTTTGYCCVQLSNFYYDGSPYDQPSDNADNRGSLLYLNEQGFSGITYDDPLDYASQLAAIGKRNLSHIQNGGGSSGGGTPIPPNANGQALRLLPLGDSITYGYLSSTLNGYRGPLRDALVSEGFDPDFVGENNTGLMYDNYNEGWPGYRIDNVDPFVARPVGNYLPNVVTLMLGTNDMNQSWDLPNAPARLGKLIDDVLAADPGATVLVANLIPSSTPLVEANIQAFNPQIPGVILARVMAGKHVALVDMSAVTTADLADNLHPNDGGYQKLANAWNAAIQTAMANGWIGTPVDCSLTPVGCSSTVFTAGTEPAGEDPNPNRPDTGFPAAPPITPIPIAVPGAPAKQPQPAAAANGWSAPIFIAGGSGAGNTVHLIDMNNDHKADYVVEVPTTGGFWGYLNNNVVTAGPTGWNGPMEWAGGASPNAVLADINGDGLPDYLIVDPVSGAVTAYLNNGGDAAGAGGWRPEGQIAGGQAPGANVRFADMNGDGYADYVMVDPATGSITVALNNGTDLAPSSGWIQAGTILSVPGASGATVQLADINGDGWADYLVVNQATGAVTALLNGGPNASAPGGWNWTSLGTIANGGGTNGWPVVFADIDGDGMADYVVVAPSNGAAWVWLNKGGSSGTSASLIPTLTGTGGWVAAGHITNGLGSGTVIFGDINGDGKADYAVIDSSNKMRALVNGGPGAQGWNWSGGGVVATGVSQNSTQLIDVDGDGFADIAELAGASGSVRLNMQTTNSDGTRAWQADQQIVNESTSVDPNNSFMFALTTGSGRANFTTIVRSTGAVGTWINMGKGPTSSDLWNFTSYEIIAYGSSSFNDATTYVDFADINGDGIADYLNVAPATGSVWAWISDGGGGLTPWGEIATGQAQPGDRVVFADINGDHLADYLLVRSDNSVDAWLNNSAGAH